MKNLKIGILSKNPEKWEGIFLYPCLITIGNYSEPFSIAENHWTIEQHKYQWQEGLKRIKTHDTTCLIKSITPTNKGTNIIAYILYKNHDKVYVQEKYMNIPENKNTLEQNTHSYLTNLCYQNIPSRLVNKKGEAINNEGEIIWEQSFDVRDL